jgi:hypothetical protein
MEILCVLWDWVEKMIFKIGNIPWNKGTNTSGSKDRHWKLSDETKRKMGLTKLGEKNPNWNGENIDRRPKYATGIHRWVCRRLSKPDACTSCGESTRLELCNISGEYHRDLTDWKYMCRKCHMLSDGRMMNLKQYSGVKRE